MSDWRRSWSCLLQGWTQSDWPQANGNLTTFESHHRYAWPAELHLMAQLTGLALRERWGDWSRSPFTGESTDHVSVWEKPVTDTGER